MVIHVEEQKFDSFYIACGKAAHAIITEHTVFKKIPDPIFFIPEDLQNEEKAAHIFTNKGRTILVGRAGLKILYIHYNVLDISMFQDLVIVDDAFHALWYIASHYGLEEFVNIEETNQ